MSVRIACFGELLVRLSPPNDQRFIQAQSLDLHIGGAEANVAMSLAQFGHDVRMISTCPQSALGDAVVSRLRQIGVDAGGIDRRPGRQGLYFLEPGAVRRPSQVIYDRQFSAFSMVASGDRDWPALLEGVDWLHLSGITPAIGPNGADCAQAIVAAAQDKGIRVSFDGNYRALLWSAWDSDPPGVLRPLIDAASIAFVNEMDLALILKTEFRGNSREDQRARAFEAAFKAFPSLERIACTTRLQASVGAQTLSGEIVSRQGRSAADGYSMSGIIDRIGGGDAFAAGVLHGVMTGRDDQYAVEFGLAASVMKHSIPGDFNIASAAEIELSMSGEGLDVKR